MWLNDHITLPDQIEYAQKQHSLVIFAGAGVSVGGDSNLPSFRELVDHIAEGTNRTPYEPYDRFLGELHGSGVHVHELTFQRINVPDSQPNQIHYDLLQLFNSPENVRLVTTNFDLHFTTAAKQIFDDHMPEIYVGPAVPRGRDFTGIIYLHGALNKSKDDFILTDQNFSDAYFTDGWATRFLQGLLHNYTVVFIGYSHRDPIIPYISLGAPGNINRYAFDDEGEDVEARWLHYGITPLLYPAKQHGILHEAINIWANRTVRGAFAKEQEIKQIASSRPPIDESKFTPILDIFKELETTRYFIQYVKDPDWITWLQEKGVLNELFSPRTSLTEIQRILAHWVSQIAISEPPEFLFRNKHHESPSFHPYFWNILRIRLTNLQSSLNTDIFNKWITILLYTIPDEIYTGHLEELLKKCFIAGNTTNALRLFKVLTTPKIQFQPPMPWPGVDKGNKDPNIDLKILGNGDQLSRLWTDHSVQQMEDIVDEVIQIGISHLYEAHSILHSYGQADKEYDIVSAMRSAIEPHPQDDIPGDFDVLIDAIRDGLGWYLQNKDSYGDSLIYKWMDSSLPVLKRIALNGLRLCSTQTPSRKLHTILERDWIFNIELHHEIYTLLHDIYPQLDNQTRGELIKRVQAGFNWSYKGEDKQRLIDYKIYRMLFWLRQADDSCPLIQEAFQSWLFHHANFQTPEHPDFTSYHSNVKSGFDDIPVSKLQGLTPPEVINRLTNQFQEEEIVWMPKARNLANAITVNDFNWGYNIAQYLIQQSNWDKELWTGIYWGWRDRELSAEEWEEIIRFLESYPQVLKPTKPLATLLERKVFDENHEFTYDFLIKVEQVSFDIYRKAKEQGDTDNFISENQDWLTNAINHSGGVLAEFWLKSLSFLYNKHPDIYNDRYTFYQQVFEEMIMGRRITEQMGCTVLMGQFHFLYSIMSGWTRNNLFALLDPESNDRHLHQAWHGYLGWGKWMDAYIEYLLPLYCKYFTFIDEQPDSIQRQFCSHLAGIALYSDINPMKNGWLFDFLRQTSSGLRQIFAQNIESNLRTMEAQAVKQVWDTWLFQYLRERGLGRPIAMDEKELHNILRWTSYLEPVIPEMIKLILTIKPMPSIDYSDLYYGLAKEKVASRYPSEVLQLIQHLLQVSQPSYLYCEKLKDLMEEILNPDIDKTVWLSVVDRLLALGCSEAHELRNLA